jgi:hypothetical protein
MKLLFPPAALLAVAWAATPAAAQAPAVVDSGTFEIFRQERKLGSESFTFETRGDSLVVSSIGTQVLERADGRDTLVKSMGLVLKHEDFELRSYESHQAFLGKKLHRGLVMSDTSFTAFFQIDEAGSADELVRPPGRIFVADPQVFTLYDVMCRDLHPRTFEQRPVLMFQLGQIDTTVEATVTDLGPESIRWGASTVRTRKLKVADGTSEFFVWISRRGRMLRLAQPAYGMRIERVAPRVTSAGARRPRPGG